MKTDKNLFCVNVSKVTGGEKQQVALIFQSESLNEQKKRTQPDDVINTSFMTECEEGHSLVIVVRSCFARVSCF